MHPELATALKERMGARSQKQFAQDLQISEGQLSRMLRGKGNPGLTKAARLILKVYPELAPFFLPENIAQAIRDSVGQSELT